MKLCYLHQIPFTIEPRQFVDADAALLWMIDTQLSRRNLTDYSAAFWR